MFLVKIANKGTSIRTFTGVETAALTSGRNNTAHVKRIMTVTANDSVMTFQKITL